MSEAKLHRQAFDVCAKLYRAHDAMKSLHGDDFPAKVAEYRPHVERMMAARKCDTLTAGLILLKRLQEKVPCSEMNQALLCATIVEMIEPSNPTPNERE